MKLQVKIKNIISIILIVILISATAYADVSNIGTAISGRGNMPYRPPHKYVSVQNPPDFTWTKYSNATEYALEIYTNENLTEEFVKIKGLKVNYYSFPYTFKTGVDYWWRVGRLVKNEWIYSDVRRFRIDPDAYEFTMPSGEELASRIPKGHPRVYTTPEDLESFRALKETKNSAAEAVYKYYYSRAKDAAAMGEVQSEPIVNPQYYDVNTQTYVDGQYENYLTEITRCKNLSGKMLSNIMECGFAYLISGDKEIGEYAKKSLLALSDWDIEGATSYMFDDQIHREVVYKSAMVYDWVYELMDEAQRAKVRDMIYRRITHVYEKKALQADGTYKVTSTSCLGNIVYSLPGHPTNSHAWTALGYLGIAAYALAGDFDPAAGTKDYATSLFNDVVTGYGAIMHPWSIQDGGWVQGTNYWQYSTVSSKEFLDILALGNVINFYEKAWSRNEPLWVMYAYPKGSYGSFGDGSNRQLSESGGNSKKAMTSVAYFADDPLARYLSGELGDTDETSMIEYATSNAGLGDTRSPSEYAPSHAFEDIGWAVMTDDLDSKEKIQFTFKSSPFGSFNHSHGDQNSFTLQAYGEKLAGITGVYDYFHSPHDVHITRQTFSHNSITMDGGLGQKAVNSFDAWGNMTQFVNQIDFDSVTGSAQNAYGEYIQDGVPYGKSLDKFDRSVIYIRPDVFVIIDDLDAAGDGESSFEWWLNTQGTINYDTDEETSLSYAVVSNNKANLRTDVLYPATTTAYYEGYVSPITGNTYAPTKNANGNDKKISFATAKTTETRMVVSMSVYPDSSEAKIPLVENKGNYLKMTYDDSTVVLVNLAEVTDNITTEEGVEFSGRAVVYNAYSIMLVNGTYLKSGESTLIDADRAISAALGHNQICLSSDDDFNVTIDTMNNFLTVNKLSDLYNPNGRNLSAAIGLEPYFDSEEGIISLSCQGGNYTVVNGANAIVSPGDLKVKNVAMHRTKDFLAALVWDQIDGRSYDTMSYGEITTDVVPPYYIGLADDVHGVRIRERYGNIAGEWSEPYYVSAWYENEVHDMVTFYEYEVEENAFIGAKTTGLPSLTRFDLVLASYDSAGNLIDIATSVDDGSVYTASIPKTENAEVKAYIWGDNVSPLGPVATYGSDNTDVTGIYVNGDLIEGFDNSKDYYEYVVPKDSKVFPYVHVTVADNASKAVVNHKFDESTVNIKVTSSKGTIRLIQLDIKHSPANLHTVTGALADTDSEGGYGDFRLDSGVRTDVNGIPGLMSNVPVGEITYTNEYGDDGIWYCYLYNNLRGNSDNNEHGGSRLFSNRAVTSGNYMELNVVPKEYTGYDYFVFGHGALGGSTEKKTNKDGKGQAGFFDSVPAMTEPKMTFNVNEDSSIIVVTLNRALDFENQGFTESSTYIQGRYINSLGDEDKFYNLVIKGRPESDIDSNGRLTNYVAIRQWVNVSPKENNYSTYEDYASAYEKGEIDEGFFDVVGNCSSFVQQGAAFDYSYAYTKKFNAGDVIIDLEPLKTGKRMMIIIKPAGLSPFCD